jgi:hypothetical protein
MVLMPVRQDDAEQVLAALLDEFQIGQDQLDAGIGRIGEGHAEIDHQPFAAAAVEIDVHADLARAAKGEKEEFVLGIVQAESFLVGVGVQKRPSGRFGFSIRLSTRALGGGGLGPNAFG